METRRSQQHFHRLVVKLCLNVTDYMDSIRFQNQQFGPLGDSALIFFFLTGFRKNDFQVDSNGQRKGP